jgi:hypothetical protein
MGKLSSRTMGMAMGTAGAAAGVLLSAGAAPGLVLGLVMGTAGAALGIWSAITATRS